jgi:fructokinase
MAMEPGNKVIEDWLTSISKNLSVTLSHDLNIRPAVGLSRENELQRVLRINSLSQIIKASDADIQWLCDLDSIEEVEEVASSWSQGKLVVITLGEKGVSAFIDGQKTQVAGFGVKLVDTVGAGDTFMSSLLGELASLGYLGSGAAPASISNQELIEVVRTANAAAALVCERTGCQPPTREEISRKLEIGS